jgi:23S rRNA (uracil1939-C5)-methyltransferase
LTLETVTIGYVGAEGDGIASAVDGARLYVPNTLPGESVQVDRLRRQGDGWLAQSVALESASRARIAPRCVHFGACGGCVLQHWQDAEYLAWKTALLASALHRAGYADPSVDPIVVTPPYSRRHMDLAARRTPDGVMVGLHHRATSPAKQSHSSRQAARVRGQAPPASLCDLTDCHVLHPSLFMLASSLRVLLARLQAVRRDASIIANLLSDGVDLLLRTDAVLTPSDRSRLVTFARAQRLLRISWTTMRREPEPVVILQPPRITLSGVAVEPPPGAFLQASAEGESAIIQAVISGLPDNLPVRARVAELYAGCGTLTFALSQRARVSAWEGDNAAVSALHQAANRAGLTGRVSSAQRDLARQPLSVAEFAGFAAVVLDPPFAGAAAQMGQIAAAKPPCVIYVSCNPAILARDARVLRDAGYELVRATPIDQFVWSARLESVSVFQR